MCPGVRPEGWLRRFAHPFGGVVCREHAQYPAFVTDTLFLLPPLQKWQLGFWSFCILLSIICPNCACMQLFLVPHSFFVFCCLRRCLSRCKHCSKVSQVPGPSLSQNLHIEPTERLPIFIKIKNKHKVTNNCVQHNWLRLLYHRIDVCDGLENIHI